MGRPILRLAMRINRCTRSTAWADMFARMVLVGSLNLVGGLSTGIRQTQPALEPVLRAVTALVVLGFLPLSANGLVLLLAAAVAVALGAYLVRTRRAGRSRRRGGRNRGLSP